MYRYVWFLLFFAAPVTAAEHTYYLRVVNNTPDAIRSLTIASADKAGGAATPIAMDLLQGGGDSMSVRFHVTSGDCLRDLRWTFVTGKVVVQRNVDVCHDQRYRIDSAVKRPSESTLTQR